MKRSLGLAVGLALLGATPAAADDTNYQSMILGHRALGMGGAFTAISEDASAAFYNPAGLTWVRGSSAGVNLSIYGLDQIDVDRGFTAVLDGQPTSVDVGSSNFGTLPNTNGYAKAFGDPQADGGRRFGAGFSVFLRDERKQAFDEVLIGPLSRGSYTQTEVDKTVWFAPSFAYRVAPRFGVGLAVVLSNRSVRRERNAAFETEDPACTPPGCPSTDVRIDEELVKYTSRDLFARIGARFDPVDRLHLGVTVTTPSVNIGGSGKVIGIHSLTMIDPLTGQGTADYDPRENDGLGVRNQQGLVVRLGAAYGETGSSMGSLDISYHAPHDYQPIDLLDPNDPDTALVSLLHVPTIERKTVVNANLGGEYYAGRFPLRGGAFTNFSSAPKVVESAENQLAHIDTYGVTASVGLQTAGGYELTLGGLVALGSGEVAAWDPEAGGGLGAYVPADATRRTFFFYVAGARKYVKTVAKDAIKRIKDSDK